MGNTESDFRCPFCSPDAENNHTPECPNHPNNIMQRAKNGNYMTHKNKQYVWTGSYWRETPNNPSSTVSYNDIHSCSVQAERKPHICPICTGKGLVPHGFYHMVGGYDNSSTAPEKCKSCNGLGIIWG